MHSACGAEDSPPEGRGMAKRKGEATMADIWRLRALNADTDLAGYEVEADDGDIGKIAEATNHVDASWLVVDTGFWIFGKRRMIPAGAISRIDVEDRKGEANRGRAKS